MEEEKINSLGEEAHNKIIRTYAEDVAGIIGSDTGGLLKKIIHGEEEHEKEKKNLSPESKKNKLFMLLGILFLFSALAVLFFLFSKKNTDTVPIEKQFTPIVFTDHNTFLEISNLNKDQIVQTIRNIASKVVVKQGGVEGIYLGENKQIIGLRKFALLIKSSFIPVDNELFVDDNFLMGVVNTEPDSISNEQKGNFFILLKVRSALDIFDALRMWENKMLSDLGGFMNIDINSETNYLLTENFKDAIIENKNARILYDKDDKIILMYLFADDNSVIITNSTKAAHEIILRLISSKKKK